VNIAIGARTCRSRHVIEENRCQMIAIDGQYGPFLDRAKGNRCRLDEASWRRQRARSRQGWRGRPLQTPLCPVKWPVRRQWAVLPTSRPEAA